MSGTIENIWDEVVKLNEKLDVLPGLLQTASQQINVVALSDITGRLGLIRAGEFRSGNNRDIGDSFSGVRIAFPPMYYPDTSTESSDLYNLVGVDADTLMIGLGASDGVLYFGGGAGRLNDSGMQLIVRGDSDATPVVSWWEEADNSMKGFISVFEVGDDSQSLSFEIKTGPNAVVSTNNPVRSQISLEAQSVNDTTVLTWLNNRIVLISGSTAGSTTGYAGAFWEIEDALSAYSLMSMSLFGDRASDGVEISWNNGERIFESKWYNSTEALSLSQINLFIGDSGQTIWGGSDTNTLLLGVLGESALTFNSTATAGIEDPNNEMGKLWLDTNVELRLTDTAGEDWYVTKSTSTGGIAARVYNGANIEIPNAGAGTALTFNSERFDGDTIHSTVINTGRLTATTAGIYQITGHVRFASNATGFREIWISFNGVTVIADHNVGALSGSVTILTVTTLYELAAGDYVELFVYQTSGGALNVESAGAYSPEFEIVKVA